MSNRHADRHVYHLAYPGPSQPYLLLASVCHLLPMRNTDYRLIGIRSKEAVEKKLLGFGIQR